MITKENAIRAECRFFAPIKAKVHYNDVMDVASIEGDWLRFINKKHQHSLKSFLSTIAESRDNSDDRIKNIQDKLPSVKIEKSSFNKRAERFDKINP